MIPTHEFWRSILECNTPKDMNKECWEKLCSIAKNMMETNFCSIKASDRFNSVLNALEYKDWKDFESDYKLEEKVKFLYDISMEWDKIMYIDKALTKGIQYAGKTLEIQSLRNKLKKVLDSLNIGRLNNKDTTHADRVLDSLMLFFCDAALEGEKPIDTYKRWDRSHPYIKSKAHRKKSTP